MRILITGSNGLIGSEAVMHFRRLGHETLGLDNNGRMEFFGTAGDTRSTLEWVLSQAPGHLHRDVDVSDKLSVDRIFDEFVPDAVIHCAGQPSHDLSATIPLRDFQVNASGTLFLLDATRRQGNNAPFVFMSTNKVYGDTPNGLELVEHETRFDFAGALKGRGVAEDMSVDQATHSPFGASKLAADVLVQEYGRYFGLPTVAFRGGCLTGPQHQGVELHGFLSHMVKVLLSSGTYTVYGYGGKQVRDQIHTKDVVRAFEVFIENPRQAAVYNLGGGFSNSASLMELMASLQAKTGLVMSVNYSSQARKGDHICYYSDLTRFKSDYPEFQVTYSLDAIIDDVLASSASP